MMYVSVIYQPKEKKKHVLDMKRDNVGALVNVAFRMYNMKPTIIIIKGRNKKNVSPLGILFFLHRAKKKKN